jgi:signal transduction histidine kinase
VGLRERAHLLQGRVQVSSAPGQGTRVEARIPVQETP